MFPIQTFSLLAHVQLINFYGWKVWFFKWPSLQRRSGIKNGLSLQLTVFSWKALEGCSFRRFERFGMDFGQLFSTLGLVKVPPKVSERIEELDAPGVAHLCHTCRSRWLSLVPTWKKISPDLCDLFSNLQVHHHYQTLLRSLESGSHGWLLWYVSMTPVLRTLPLMRPQRFKCLPNTQIKQILRGIALQHVTSMSPCPMIQYKKQEGHSMESCKLCKLQLNFCWNISGTNSQNPKCNHVQLRCQLRCSFHQLHRFFYLSVMRNPGSVDPSAMAVAGAFESATQKTQASGQKHSWPVQLSHHPLVEIERYKEGISATLMIWVLQIIGRGLFFATDVGITASSSKTRANLRFWKNSKPADQKNLAMRSLVPGTHFHGEPPWWDHACDLSPFVLPLRPLQPLWSMPSRQAALCVSGLIAQLVAPGQLVSRKYPAKSPSSGSARRSAPCLNSIWWFFQLQWSVTVSRCDLCLWGHTRSFRWGTLAALLPPSRHVDHSGNPNPLGVASQYFR